MAQRLAFFSVTRALDGRCGGRLVVHDVDRLAFIMTSLGKKIAPGVRLKVLNKYGNELANGFITEVNRLSFTFREDNGQLISILKRQIGTFTQTEIILTIKGEEI